MNVTALILGASLTDSYLTGIILAECAAKQQEEVLPMPTVVMVCHDSPTRDTCPALYRTDQGEYYVQGYTETNPVILTQMKIPEGETVVRITPELLRMIAKAYASTQLGGAAASGKSAVEVLQA
jgi:hypothetical protein